MIPNNQQAAFSETPVIKNNIFEYLSDGDFANAVQTNRDTRSYSLTDLAWTSRLRSRGIQLGDVQSGGYREAYMQRTGHDSRVRAAKRIRLALLTRPIIPRLVSVIPDCVLAAITWSVIPAWLRSRGIACELGIVSLVMSQTALVALNQCPALRNTSLRYGIMSGCGWALGTPFRTYLNPSSTNYSKEDAWAQGTNGWLFGIFCCSACIVAEYKLCQIAERRNLHIPVAMAAGRATFQVVGLCQKFMPIVRKVQHLVRNVQRGLRWFLS